MKMSVPKLWKTVVSLLSADPKQLNWRKSSMLINDVIADDLDDINDEDELLFKHPAPRTQESGEEKDPTECTCSVVLAAVCDVWLMAFDLGQRIG
jgi:hypothetical protein